MLQKQGQNLRLSSVSGQILMAHNCIYIHFYLQSQKSRLEIQGRVDLVDDSIARSWKRVQYVLLVF